MSVVQPKLNNYVFTVPIGSGSYATVYKAHKKQSNSEVVAVKCIKKSSLNKSSVENLVKEIEVLKKLNHENIVQLLDFQWDSHYIYLIMEFCSGGDLSQFIRLRKTLPEFTVKKFLQQIASAMKVLHEKKISHFDLKPHNILLTSSNHPIIKLADFGFAQFRDTSEENKSENYLRGSPLYMAPEIILDKNYTEKADLWSLGVILYESLFGRAPYASTDTDEFLKKIVSQTAITIPNSPSISDECRDLLAGLLNRDPEKRISFEEFFNHEFVDLKHRPSPDCIEEAILIVNKAIKADEKEDISEACDLYSEAIRYFISAIYYETDSIKKSQLRSKVKQYVDRAEHLKVIFEIKNQKNSDFDERKRQLLSLTSRNKKINMCLKTLYYADYLENQGKYKEAVKYYEDTIEKLLPSASNQPKILKKLLHTEIKKYIDRIEVLKTLVQDEKTEVDTEKATIENTDDNLTGDNLTGDNSTEENETTYISSSKCSIQ